MEQYKYILKKYKEYIKATFMTSCNFTSTSIINDDIYNNTIKCIFDDKKYIICCFIEEFIGDGCILEVKLYNEDSKNIVDSNFLFLEDVVSI